MKDWREGHDTRVEEFMTESNGLFSVHFIGPDDLDAWFARAGAGDATALRFQVAMGRMALQARAGRGSFCIRCRERQFTGTIAPFIFVFGEPDVPEPQNVMFGGFCEACCTGMTVPDLTKMIVAYCNEHWGPSRQIDIGEPGHA